MFSIRAMASAASSAISRTRAGISFKSRQLGRAPAPFAGDDFVAAFRHRAHQDRLHHALGLDRIGQLLQ